MAKFTDKTWTDRVSEQPQRRLLTPTDGSTAMTVDVTRQEGIVIQEGDAFSANNMNDLEQRIKTAIDANDSAITSVTQKANTNQQNISTLSGTVTTLNTKVTTIEGELTANGRRIYMDYKNGKYGYNLSANRGADTFFPFKGTKRNLGSVSFDDSGSRTISIASIGDYDINNYILAMSSCSTRVGLARNGDEGESAIASISVSMRISGTNLIISASASGSLNDDPFRGQLAISGNVYYVG